MVERQEICSGVVPNQLAPRGIDDAGFAADSRPTNARMVMGVHVGAVALFDQQMPELRATKPLREQISKALADHLFLVGPVKRVAGSRKGESVASEIEAYVNFGR